MPRGHKVSLGALKAPVGAGARAFDLVLPDAKITSLFHGPHGRVPCKAPMGSGLERRAGASPGSRVESAAPIRLPFKSELLNNFIQYTKTVNKT